MNERNDDGTTVLPAHRFSWRHPAWLAYLQVLKRTDWPILVGPWHGEVGFEVLYWIPFVRMLLEAGIPKERIFPISRGGAAAWYGVPQGLELYAMRTPQQVRIQHRLGVAQTGVLKQETISTFDRQVLHDAADTLKLGRKYHVVHPAWMYHRFAPYWTGHRGLEWLAARTRYQPLSTPALPASIVLPEAFVAVRFYSRQTFPIRDKHVQPFMEATLQQIVQTLPVIVLDSDLSLDDHADLTQGVRGERLQHLRDFGPLTPETNLAISSAVLARATGFVGTYGGFAQLALRLGTPSISFFTDWKATSMQHRALADLLSLRMGVPAYVCRIGDIPMLSTILPEATMTPPKVADTPLLQHA